MSKKLHYIYDPYCSWCYAVSPFIKYANSKGLEVVLHGGGMITGERVNPPTPELRKLLKDNQPRISQLAGVAFSQAYYQTLDQDWPMNSVPPSAAVLAAEKVAGKGLEMINAIQNAQFQVGQVISQKPTLDVIAAELGLSAEKFDQAYFELVNADINEHFRQTRELMSVHGCKGFPSLLLEQGGGLGGITTQDVYGKQSDWDDLLKLS